MQGMFHIDLVYIYKNIIYFIWRFVGLLINHTSK